MGSMSGSGERLFCSVSTGFAGSAGFCLLKVGERQSSDHDVSHNLITVSLINRKLNLTNISMDLVKVKWLKFC